MSYITLSNMMSIIYQTDLEVIDGSRELYKNPIYFFSEFEKKRLLAVYELFEDSDLFFAETYVPRKGEDTLTMVYEGNTPSYHENIECNRLRSDYENFKIPPDIRQKGKVAVNEFREWFKTVEHLYKEAPDILTVSSRVTCKSSISKGLPIGITILLLMVNSRDP
mgnify:CR=1 FL=1